MTRSKRRRMPPVEFHPAMWFHCELCGARNYVALKEANETRDDGTIVYSGPRNVFCYDCETVYRCRYTVGHREGEKMDAVPVAVPVGDVRPLRKQAWCRLFHNPRAIYLGMGRLKDKDGSEEVIMMIERRCGKCDFTWIEVG